MATEKEIMRELHEIREQLYEETKHMPPEKRLEHEQRDLAGQLAKLGMTLKRPSAETLSHAMR